MACGAKLIVCKSVAKFASSGRVVIESPRGALDCVDYSSISTRNLTVDTTKSGVGMSHADAEHTETLYALPSDYAKTREMIVDTSLYRMEKYYTLFPPGGRFMTVAGFVFFPKNMGVHDITHYYDKSAATISATGDTTDIPVQFQRYAIEMTLHHVFRIRRQRADAPTSLALAEIELDRAINYDIQFISDPFERPLHTPF